MKRLIIFLVMTVAMTSFMFVLLVTGAGAETLTNLLLYHAGNLESWATAEEDARAFLEVHGVAFPEGAGIKWSDREKGTLVLRNTPDNIKRAARVMSRNAVLPITIRLKIAVAKDGLDSPTATTLLLKSAYPRDFAIHYTTQNGTNEFSVRAIAIPLKFPRAIQMNLFFSPHREIPPHIPHETNYPTIDVRLIKLQMTDGVPMFFSVDYDQNPEHRIRFKAIVEQLLESGQPIWR